MGFFDARREPQRGPGNHYRGALSQPHSICVEREETWGRMSTHHPTIWVLGSIVSSPSGVGGKAPAENILYAYLRSEPSHLGHPFQYFRAMAGPPNITGPGKLSASLSTGLQVAGGGRVVALPNAGVTASCRGQPIDNYQ